MSSDGGLYWCVMIKIVPHFFVVFLIIVTFPSFWSFDIISTSIKREGKFSYGVGGGMLLVVSLLILICRSIQNGVGAEVLGGTWGRVHGFILN